MNKSILNVKDIEFYINNFYIKSGNVYSTDNILQTDENTILKVKASRLIFNEAKIKYQNDIKQFGKTSKTKEQYIEKEISKYGLNGEQNFYPQNKTVNNILNSNGIYEESYMGDTLESEKYGMLYGEKKEYGLAILRLKAREMGKDIDSIQISIDSTNFKKDGNSKVSIHTKYKKNGKEHESSKNSSNNNIEYEQSDFLRYMEEKKQDAKANNDSDAVKYYEANIREKLKKDPIKISSKNWETMDFNSKQKFIELKMKEARILNDIDAFNYWKSNKDILADSEIPQNEGRIIK